MTARLRLQPEAIGVGMTSQRVRDRLIERLRDGAHPGGGITGVPGRNAAAVVLEDAGLGGRRDRLARARERAALRWADALNALPQRDDTDAAYGELREHFNETQIAELGYAIAVIRGWNVINLSLRNPIPVNPPPGM